MRSASTHYENVFLKTPALIKSLHYFVPIFPGLNINVFSKMNTTTHRAPSSYRQIIIIRKNVWLPAKNMKALERCFKLKHIPCDTQLLHQFFARLLVWRISQISIISEKLMHAKITNEQINSPISRRAKITIKGKEQCYNILRVQNRKIKMNQKFNFFYSYCVLMQIISFFSIILHPL